MQFRNLYSSGAGVNKPKRREIVAWIIVFLQFVTLANFLSPSRETKYESYTANDHQQKRAPVPVPVLNSDKSVNDKDNDNNINLIDVLKMNNHKNTYYQHRKISAENSNNMESFYEKPVIHPKDAGLVSRIWRSNGAPSIHSDLHQGSCWCSFDEWCMCTPSLAIDLVMTSGPDHLWVIRRQDTGLLALMGGFTEVGETSLETVSRELMEEMNLELTTAPTLFGVYNDPLRDSRRHTTSVVYIVDIPKDAQPKAGDDATNVIRLPLADVEKNDFFVDHKTILHDFIKMRGRERGIAAGFTDIPPIPIDGDGEPFRRSVCPMN